MYTSTRRGHIWVWLSFLLAYTLTLADFSFAQDKKPLRKKIQRQVVENVVPAIESQDEIRFLNASMPLFDSLKSSQIELVDDLCREHGVTPATQWFTELVLSKYHQGIDPSQVTSDLDLAAVALNGVITRLTEFEKSSAKHTVMQDPLEVPSDFQESEELFWELHVLHNEFENASRDLQFARALASKHKRKLERREKDRNYPEELAAIEQRVQQHYEAIEERVAELRWQRFEVAHQTLAEPESKDDFELMLTSAMALEQDGQVLIAFLTGNDSINREILADPELLDRVNEMMVSGRASAGDVATKANLFRNGLHYWVRGRFGSGPIANGLVKAVGSTSSVQAMEALYMPKIRNEPISNFLPEEESSEGYDRRHYKTWDAEYRPVSVVNKSSESRSSSVLTGRSSNTYQESRFL